MAETLMAIVIILKNKKYTLKHISIEINVFVKVTTAIRMYIRIYIEYKRAVPKRTVI